MRDQGSKLTKILLTFAGAMFMVPVVVFIPTKLTMGEVSATILEVGL